MVKYLFLTFSILSTATYAMELPREEHCASRLLASPYPARVAADVQKISSLNYRPSVEFLSDDLNRALGVRLTLPTIEDANKVTSLVYNTTDYRLQVMMGIPSIFIDTEGLDLFFLQFLGWKESDYKDLMQDAWSPIYNRPALLAEATHRRCFLQSVPTVELALEKREDGNFLRKIVITPQNQDDVQQCRRFLVHYADIKPFVYYSEPYNRIAIFEDNLHTFFAEMLNLPPRIVNDLFLKGWQY